MPLRKRQTRRGMITLASLADVIFLLLLYFILSSTFSRFGELELLSGTAGAGAAAPAERQVLFVQIAPDALTLNGAPTTTEGLRAAIAALLPEGGGAQAILSLRDGVDAQAMTDVLVALRRVPGVTVTVIG